MRPDILRAIVTREWRELLRNRLLLASVIIPPLVLTVLPVVVVSLASQDQQIPQGLVDALQANHPEWSDMSATQVAQAFALNQFLASFLLLPGYIPLAIASYSIVGEKQSRSLEAVLATPVRTAELLGGKAIAAVTPAVFASWLAYAIVVDLAYALLGPRLAAVLVEPSWLGATFALGPAIGLVSVTAGLLVSSRVNDPRAAQQIGAVVLLPIIGIVVLQTAGTFLIDLPTYLVAAVVTLAIAAAGLRLGVAVFARESILTRWK